ncbi:MAG: amylo-alpha-1,6-glucosidase, partial [Bacteroidales bacterium]|nr:amylo-alpha-1,6-glucosidase [Bacteroidales bacterium]
WLGVGQLRDTFITASGLTLYRNGDVKSFQKIIDDILGKWKEDLYTTTIQVDAPLRLAVAMQEYIDFTGDAKGAWNRWGKILKEILKSYMTGRPEVQMHDNGLLWASMPGTALSWMNTYIDGRPINERAGYQVETNALWYNALMFAAKMESNKNQKETYSQIAAKIKAVFYDMFWVEARQHLADYVGYEGQNVFTRPNQLYACGLEFSPIDEEAQAKVLKAVKRELLTTKGIRTLSPKNPLYRGIYEGNQEQRDTASHNGCTRAWLLAIYAAAMTKLYGKAFLDEAIQMIPWFEEDMTSHGVGTLAEIYDGDPPHNPHGAISSSTSISAIYNIKYLIKYLKEGK